jgi:hypothetical protein
MKYGAPKTCPDQGIETLNQYLILHIDITVIVWIFRAYKPNSGMYQ